MKLGRRVDDDFNVSMLRHYAQEMGEGSGVYTMDKQAAKNAASRILEKQQGMRSGDIKSYLDLYFDRAWNQVDESKDGSIKVEKSAELMRTLF